MLIDELWSNLVYAASPATAAGRRVCWCRTDCNDNAVAESFFQLLKRERIRRHVYSTREATRTAVINYIEMFYNSKRRHCFNDQLSPVEYKKRFAERLVSV